jgi:hypothetical protein
MPRRATRSENYEHTIAGLLSKRQELMDRALQLREQMAAISNDIESVETVLRSFGHDGDFKGMAARSGRVVYFHRNELRRFCIDELRKATAPVTSRELAEKIVRLEGKDPHERRLMNDMVKRVGKSLKLLRQQHHATQQRINGTVVWRLANSESVV